MHDECCGGHRLPRRQVLQGGIAAAAVGTLGAVAAGPGSALAASATGKMRAIDIHAHYFPETYLDVLANEGERYGFKYTPNTSESFFIGKQSYQTKFTDLKIRLAEMDAQGVKVHALSLTAPMLYWADAEVSHKLARAFNDGASAAHAAHPDRFVGLLTLPMLDPDRALDELNRASQLPGIRGVYLGTNIQDRDLDDPLFTPIFARIEALGLPIFLHPLKTVGGARLKDYYLYNLIGNPVDTAIAAAHLIFGGVLDRFPKLEIALPHSGGVMPILMGRWDRGYKMRAVLKQVNPLQTVPDLPQKPSAYLRRFTYDTVAHSKDTMKFVISQVGIDRIMLGSDYCFAMGDENPVETVHRLGLDAKQQDMVLRGTAARLLKL